MTGFARSNGWSRDWLSSTLAHARSDRCRRTSQGCRGGLWHPGFHQRRQGRHRGRDDWTGYQHRKLQKTRRPIHGSGGSIPLFGLDLRQANLRDCACRQHKPLTITYVPNAWVLEPYAISSSISWPGCLGSSRAGPEGEKPYRHRQ